MSNEFILLLICLAVGIIISTYLLIKNIVEVKKTRQEFSKIHKKPIKQFKKEFMKNKIEFMEEIDSQGS